MNRNFKFNNHNLYLVLIYFFWAISILFYFLFNEYIKDGNLEDGVKLGNDSRFYLRESKNILNGLSSIFDYKSKFGYLLFLIPFLYFDLPLIYVVLLQFLF